MPRLIIAALFAAVLAPLIAPSGPSPRATCVVDGAPALPATVMFRAVVPAEGALVAECAVVEPIIVPAAGPDGGTPTRATGAMPSDSPVAEHGGTERPAPAPLSFAADPTRA